MFLLERERGFQEGGKKREGVRYGGRRRRAWRQYVKMDYMIVENKLAFVLLLIGIEKRR